MKKVSLSVLFTLIISMGAYCQESGLEEDKLPAIAAEDSYEIIFDENSTSDPVGIDYDFLLWVESHRNLKNDIVVHYRDDIYVKIYSKKEITKENK